MPEVTKETILNYMIRKGGVVKNVDLVRHFKKYLMLDSPRMKEHAREDFKEKVNSIAFIRVNQGEKYLHLKPEYLPPAGLSRPPSGRPQPLSDANRQSTTTSLESRTSAILSPPPGLSSTPPSASSLFESDVPTPPPSANNSTTHHYYYSSALGSSSRPAPPRPPDRESSLSSLTAPRGIPASAATAASSSSSPHTPPTPRGLSVSVTKPSGSSLLDEMSMQLNAFATGQSSDIPSFSTSPVLSHVTEHSTTTSSVSKSTALPVTNGFGLSPPRTNHQQQHLHPLSMSSSAGALESLLGNSLVGEGYLFGSSNGTVLSQGGDANVPPSIQEASSISTTASSAYHHGGKNLVDSSSIPHGGAGDPVPVPLPIHRREASDSGAIYHRRDPSDTGSIGSSHSVGGGVAMSSRSKASPQHLNQLSPTSSLTRPRTYTGGGAQNPVGVPMRRHRSPQESLAVGRSQSTVSALKKSRQFEERKQNLDKYSLSSTPPLMRKAPAVAPKLSHRTSVYSSKENISGEGEDEGSLEQAEEYYYDEGIDPLEKEWMMGAVVCNMDLLHRMIMSDSSIINKKDFVYGYTALHWAAKNGRCDVISGLAMNGANLNIKSNGGFTPLHLAAQTGHNNAIKLLIEHGGKVNARDHSGRRPVDILSAKASESTRTLLSKNLNSYGFRLPAHPPTVLITFNKPHKTKRGSLHRQWSSLGHLPGSQIMDPRVLNKRRLSPRMSIRKTFSFRRKTRVKAQSTASGWDI